MTSGDVARLFDRAVLLSRASTGADDDWDELQALLFQASSFPGSAMGHGQARLTAADPDERFVACCLLGLVAARNEEHRAAVTDLLLPLIEVEADENVLWALVSALGNAGDGRALPALIRMADHPDGDIREAVAVGYPIVSHRQPEHAWLPTLLRLCADPAPGVRNWATFALAGAEADSDVIRQMFWTRSGDDDPDTRVEGIHGLAYRRDPRAAPLLAELLAGEPYLLTFLAVEMLADPALLPLLAEFEADDFVADALLACDPVASARFGELSWELFEQLWVLAPAADFVLFCEVYEPGLYLEAEVAGRKLRWHVPSLLRKAEDDLDLAARLVVADLPA